MRYLPAVLFHLLPAIPLALGYYPLTIGAALFVGLAYVKTQKLRATEVESLKKNPNFQDPGLRKTMRFWEQLTFLKPWPLVPRESIED